MKKIGLIPTNIENLKESLINDTTGRNENIINFIRLLNSCTDDTWTIAINGKWGTGKTFFVKQCKYVIDHYNDENCNQEIKTNLLNKVNINNINYKTIYFDSWENDNEIDPLVSIVNEISKEYNPGKKVQQKVKNILKNVLNLTEKGKDVSKLLDGLFNQNSEFKNPIMELNKEFDSIIKNNNDRLVVFIDELDRCRPSYAVKLLERIQHCFTNNKLTFVFSVSLTELSQTVKKFYGDNYDGDGYLQRFFDLELPLPEPDLSNYYKQTEELKDKGYYFDQYCKEIARYFNFSLRELNRFYLRVNFLEEEATSMLSDKTIRWDLSEKLEAVLQFTASFFIEPYLIGLKMVSNEKFNNFIEGNNEASIGDILVNNSLFKEMINPNYENKIIDIVHELYTVIFSDGSTILSINKNNKLILGENNINLTYYSDSIRKQILNDVSLISDSVNYDK